MQTDLCFSLIFSSAAVEEDEGVVVGAINPKIEPSETETKPTFPQKKEEEEEDIMAPQVMIDENGQIVLNNERFVNFLDFDGKVFGVSK